MTLKVRLDAGALARYLGHAGGFPVAPDDLDDLVIPVLEISPFIGAEAAISPGAGPGPPVGVGIGTLSIQALADPAAGTNPVWAVPADKIWRMLAVHGRLTTEATAGMREVSYLVDENDLAKPLVRGLPALEQAASLGFSYTFAEWAADNQRSDSSVGLAAEKIPANLYMLAGWRIRLLTNNIKPLDQWTQLRAVVSEYPAT